MYNQNINQNLDQNMPYLLPANQNATTGLATNPNHKMTRAEKKALKHANVGGPFIATVAPREEMFMGHQPINEIQKPGLATGYGIPEHGAQQLGTGQFGNGQQFQNQSYGTTGLSNQTYSTGQSSYLSGQTYGTGYQQPSNSTVITETVYQSQGSPRVLNQGSPSRLQGSPRLLQGGSPTGCIFESNQVPSYTTQSLGTHNIGQTYSNQQTEYVKVIEQPVLIQQQQPLLQQQPMMQQQQQQQVTPVQVQGYYDGMLLEQPHEKAGGFFAPFTGSLKNHGAGVTSGLQGQGKANFTNTVASALPFGQGGQQPGYGQTMNPLSQAPNITYPVALEGERLHGLNNAHTGLNPVGTGASGQKLSRKEKRAQKKAAKNGGLNPEYNNAAIY